jgi:hypothetical protein
MGIRSKSWEIQGFNEGLTPQYSLASRIRRTTTKRSSWPQLAIICSQSVLIAANAWPSCGEAAGRPRNGGVPGKQRRARRPVSRVLSRLLGDGHSSGTPVAGRLARPTRAATRKTRLADRSPPCRPYLVLLPVGFALPSPLPATRCALTAPFHPCRPKTLRIHRARRFAFCGTVPGVAPAGR